jgi:hypothetical protein
LPGLTVGAERSRSDTAELTVNDQSSFLAGVDPDGKAWLLDRGGVHDDLSHNLSIDVVANTPEIQTTGYTVVSASKLYNDSGDVAVPVKGSAVRLEPMSVYAPVVAQSQPVCGLVTLDYRIRHIAVGNNTIPESDDVIQTVVGYSDAGFLFSPPPYTPTFGIQARLRELQYQIGKGQADRLTFASLDDASAFREWLIESRNDGTLQNAKLGYFVGHNWHQLTTDDLDDLLVIPSNGEAMKDVAAKSRMKCPAPPPRATAAATGSASAH